MPWTLTRVPPAAGPASGGTRVSVHGTHLDGFYRAGPNPKQGGAFTSACRFGARRGQEGHAERADAAVCYAPPNALGALPVELTLNGQDFFGSASTAALAAAAEARCAEAEQAAALAAETQLVRHAAPGVSSFAAPSSHCSHGST